MTDPSQQPPTKLRGKALLFGMNYGKSQGALRGCINDVFNMADFLRSHCGLHVDVYTDQGSGRLDTTGAQIVRRIKELALDSHLEKLDFAFIHYSGHGTHIKDLGSLCDDDWNEALVPSDYKSEGVVVTDDFLNCILAQFNPDTHIVCVFDCCHSGKICDLKYTWEHREPIVVSNESRSMGKVLVISGCRNDQTSVDAFNICGDDKYAGALTSCLLMAIEDNPSICENAFALHEATIQKLRERQFDQVPVLQSSYEINKMMRVFPVVRTGYQRRQQPGVYNRLTGAAAPRRPPFPTKMR